MLVFIGYLDDTIGFAVFSKVVFAFPIYDTGIL